MTPPFIVSDRISGEEQPWGVPNSDLAGLRYNIAVYVSVLMGVVLVMRVGPRLIARLREPAGNQAGRSSACPAPRPILGGGDGCCGERGRLLDTLAHEAHNALIHIEVIPA
jgi:hypothetical protein